MCLCIGSHTYMSLLREPRDNHHNSKHTQSPGLDFQMSFSDKRNQDSMKKSIIPGLEQEQYKMSLPYAEKKQVLKKG